MKLSEGGGASPSRTPRTDPVFCGKGETPLSPVGLRRGGPADPKVLSATCEKRKPRYFCAKVAKVVKVLNVAYFIKFSENDQIS